MLQPTPKELLFIEISNVMGFATVVCHRIATGLPPCMPPLMEFATVKPSRGRASVRFATVKPTSGRESVKHVQAQGSLRSLVMPEKSRRGRNRNRKWV